MSDGTGIATIADGNIAGFLHTPARADGRGLVLTHGAGGNCARAAARRLRRSVRRRRDDRAALRSAVPAKARRTARRIQRPRPRIAPVCATRSSWLRGVPGAGFLGGHSYGGRQASMLAAEQPDIAAALLLLSYPLHPPAKPEQLRTAHFANLRTTRCVRPGDVIRSARSPRLERAIAAIPAATRAHRRRRLGSRSQARAVRFRADRRHAEQFQLGSKRRRREGSGGKKNAIATAPRPTIAPT